MKMQMLNQLARGSPVITSNPQRPALFFQLFARPKHRHAVALHPHALAGLGIPRSPSLAFPDLEGSETAQRDALIMKETLADPFEHGIDKP